MMQVRCYQIKCVCVSQQNFYSKTIIQYKTFYETAENVQGEYTQM